MRQQWTLKVKNDYQGNKDGRGVKVIILEMGYWFGILHCVLQYVTERCDACNSIFLIMNS